MNPDLEDFLQATFDSITSPPGNIGRVILKPDYEAALNPEDRAKLREELVTSLAGKTADTDFDPPAEHKTLSHYIRHITLQGERIPDAPWVQVEPAGEWI
jgi:hypothetical protein